MQIRNVEKKYGDDVVFSDLNLELPSSGLFLIKGNNGSGKTTLLNIIANITSYKGKVSKEYLNNMCFLFQNSYLLESYTIKQHFDLFKIKYKYLKEIRLMNKLDSYPSELSSGQRQRIANILSLYSDRHLVILDEPFSNLDIKNKKIISRIIKEQKNKKLILLVTHDDGELKDVDGIIYINKENVKFKKNKIENNPNKITKNIKNRDKIYLKEKKKYLKSGIILALIPLTMFLIFNSINIFYYLHNKDVIHSVDYNKFYLKSCENIVEGNFQINECKNPNVTQLENMQYGYNYDYLLNYLYGRDDLKIMNNDNIELKEGRYPRNENEILANSRHFVGEIIALEADVILQENKIDFYKESKNIEIVGIYHDLIFANDENFYFDYDIIDDFFETKMLKNNNISFKEFFKKLDIDSYKYVSFSNTGSYDVSYVGEKYETYKNIFNLISKIEILVEDIIFIVVTYIGYQFIKLYKSLIMEDRKIVMYLKSNSHNCLYILFGKILFSLIGFFCVLLLQLLFCIIANLSWRILGEISILFVLITFILVFYTLYLHRRKIIGIVMRENI